MVLSRVLPLLVSLHGSVPTRPRGQSAGAAVLESALAKPSPERPWPRGSPRRWALTAAKNEYESFLVVLNGPLQGVRVAPPAFPQGTARSMVFAARYVKATRAAGCLGRVGLTMDPRVPDGDVLVG
eukprot:COSAG04_NODE_21216_length_378_cov_0.584229_1_plen_125_part_11